MAHANAIARRIHLLSANYVFRGLPRYGEMASSGRRRTSYADNSTHSLRRNNALASSSPLLAGPWARGTGVRETLVAPGTMALRLFFSSAITLPLYLVKHGEGPSLCRACARLFGERYQRRCREEGVKASEGRAAGWHLSCYLLTRIC